MIDKMDNKSCTYHDDLEEIGFLGGKRRTHPWRRSKETLEGHEAEERGEDREGRIESKGFLLSSILSVVGVRSSGAEDLDASKEHLTVTKEHPIQDQGIPRVDPELPLVDEPYFGRIAGESTKPWESHYHPNLVPEPHPCDPLGLLGWVFLALSALSSLGPSLVKQSKRDRVSIS
ncbi:hypothetical protein BHE74_00015114 [Ensete ventricosum]|nr:hypothetical protein BHE74_00015114 [Ensete ventricosum]